MNPDPRYPIGVYQPAPYSFEKKEEWVTDIRYLPQLLENALLNLDEQQLVCPYREGGWTIQQLVHHIADSHINAYCRFKLGLTEQNPVTIRPYDEKAWADLADVRDVPVNISVTLLHALHRRWHHLLESLSTEDWQKEVLHPEHGTRMTLWYLLGNYSWHGRHHVAHITALREQKKW